MMDGSITQLIPSGEALVSTAMVQLVATYKSSHLLEIECYFFFTPIGFFTCGVFFFCFFNLQVMFNSNYYGFCLQL